MSSYTHQIPEFFDALPPQGRLIALDVGEKTIGLAMSDASRMVASPLQLITRTKFSKDVALLATLIAEHAVSGIIIGYPVNMDGSEGPRCQSTRQFARDMATKVSLPTLLWDERLSTVAVNRMMIDEADLSRKRRGELVDKLAATYMLQGVLDALGNQ
ncbi:MAG: Holliday junction resolvase RuvX [Rickettsiales bacterium]